jgi:hypothetical protein
MKPLRFATAALCFLLVGCTSIRPLSDDPTFRGLVGSDVTTVRPTLLWKLEERRLFQPDFSFDLYDRDSGNSWRKDGWLPAGTTLTILEINRYVTDARGAWIGVLGVAETPEGPVKFLYTWPSHHFSLERAPWEGSETPESRPLEALR